MVLNAKDLTIHAVNSAYYDLLAGREVISKPLTEVFGGKDMSEFIKVLTRSVQNAEVINTPPFTASVGGADGDGDGDSRRFVHTIVPIADPSGSIIDRLFVYSEGVE